MQRHSNITSVETKAGFQEKMVENFVKINLPPKTYKENKISGMAGFSASYKEIEYCAAELKVNGAVEIFYALNNTDAIMEISVPVVSRFIVFCTREDRQDYKVAWSCSYS